MRRNRQRKTPSGYEEKWSLWDRSFLWHHQRACRESKKRIWYRRCKSIWRLSGAYQRGPGDSSPQSRFVKATYLLHNVTLKEKDDIYNISQGFHILNNVSTLIGECNSDLGTFEYKFIRIFIIQPILNCMLDFMKIIVFKKLMAINLKWMVKI